MPTLTIFAGINGSGKTTLYEALLPKQKKQNLGIRLNLDEMLIKMNGNKNSLIDNAKASRMVVDNIYSCINSKLSFNWETTFFSSKSIDIIQHAIENGYNINIHFIAVTDINTAIRRVEARKKLGDHYVSEDILKGRYKNQFLNLGSILKLSDNFYFYENNNSIELVGKYQNKKFTYTNKQCTWLKKLIENNLAIQL